MTPILTNTPATIQRLIDAAIAEGRHGRTWTLMCHGCRELMDGICATVLGSRTHLCRACATRAGLWTEFQGALAAQAAGEGR